MPDRFTIGSKLDRSTVALDRGVAYRLTVTDAEYPGVVARLRVRRTWSGLEPRDTLERMTVESSTPEGDQAGVVAHLLADPAWLAEVARAVGEHLDLGPDRLLGGSEDAAAEDLSASLRMFARRLWLGDPGETSQQHIDALRFWAHLGEVPPIDDRIVDELLKAIYRYLDEHRDGDADDTPPAC